jgi:hypothetical protein
MPFANGGSRARVSNAAMFLLGGVAVLMFAAQWYIYDATHFAASPFSYYVWWVAYLSTLVTPSAIWLTRRFPITASSWRRALPVHIAANIVLTVTLLLLEAYIGWLDHSHLSPAAAIRHYFVQHSQLSVLTYWLVVAGTLFHNASERARESTLRSTKLETQLSNARLEVLRRQLHPHFLFNTLQAATTLVHDDPDRAEEVLVRLSELLRVSVYESEQHEIPLRRELSILEHYMSIQECRYRDRLRFDVQADPDALSCLVPSLILQPLVENAVRHGVEKHRASDTVTVRAKREGDRLTLTVANAVGALNGAAALAAGGGFGVAGTIERLEQQYGPGHAFFQLRDQRPAGVRAEVVIPLRLAPDAALDVEDSANGHSRVDR